MTVKSTLRAAFNVAARPLGVELVRFRRDTMNDVLAAAHAKGLAPRSIIDVGVAYGTPDLYNAFPTADLLLIEPVSEWEPVMMDWQAKRGAKYMVAAAGSAEGEITIQVPEVLAWAGVNYGAPGAEARVVEMVTVDAAIKRHSMKPPYVLKVDVEGFELDVLAGALGTLPDCEAVLLETWLDGTFAPLVELMSLHGFVVHDIYQFHHRAGDDVLVAVDLMFTRRDGDLRRECAANTATLDPSVGELRLQRSALDEASRRGFH